jgi:hypothetical protein
MPKSCIKGVSHRLRAGQPVVQKGCPSGGTTSYVLQSFGAERRTTHTFRATDSILCSSDFIGLSQSAEYETANYQGTNYVSKDGDILLSGQEVKIVEYISESQMPGVNNFIFSNNI